MKDKRNKFDKPGFLVGEDGVRRNNSRMMVIFATRDEDVGSAKKRQKYNKTGQIIETEKKIGGQKIKYRFVYRRGMTQNFIFYTCLRRLQKAKGGKYVAKFRDYKDLYAATWSKVETLDEERLEDLKETLRDMKVLRITMKVDGRKRKMNIVDSIQKTVDKDGNKYLRIYLNKEFVDLYSGLSSV